MPLESARLVNPQKDNTNAIPTIADLINDYHRLSESLAKINKDIQSLENTRTDTINRINQTTKKIDEQYASMKKAAPSCIDWGNKKFMPEELPEV